MGGWVVTLSAKSRGGALGLIAVLALTLAFLPRDAEAEERVAFNVESRKYHCLTCRHALACTKSCIEISLSEAKRRGGVPCKVCGGKCSRSPAGGRDPAWQRVASAVHEAGVRFRATNSAELRSISGPRILRAPIRRAPVELFRSASHRLESIWGSPNE
jgi:hypothetical protein